MGSSIKKIYELPFIKKFDNVVFSAELNKVHGPVKTQFGYHLIEITNRSD